MWLDVTEKLCKQEAKDPVTSLSSSPRGAAVRQGLDIIDKAHRMGDAKLKLAESASFSSGEGAHVACSASACLRYLADLM